MNNDTLKGMWKQLTGNVKATFGKLTDDDLLQAEGNAEAMVGRLQERYGYTREQAESEWNKFLRGVDENVDDAKDAVRRSLS